MNCNGNDMAPISSDPEETRRRLNCLESYFSSNVLSGDQFVCSSVAKCKSSHLGNFFEGQLHHIGQHYDLRRGGTPLRIVVVGQEYGHEPPHVTLSARHNMVAIGSGVNSRFTRTVGKETRNPHMKG